MDRALYCPHTGSSMSCYKYFIGCQIYCLVSDEENEWTLSLSITPVCLDQTMFSI